MFRDSEKDGALRAARALRHHWIAGSAAAAWRALIWCEALEERLCLTGVGFSAPVSTAINTSEYYLTATGVADVNNDGIPDIVAGQADGAAQVFTGTTTGAFAPGSLAGPAAQILTLADFNSDGNIDLATAVAVLPGNGDGTFAASSSANNYVLPPNTVALYAADVNGDGNQDLVAATYAPGTSSTAATVGVTVMLGNGDGTFIAPVSTVVASAIGLPQSDANFELDDINNDGQLDLVSAFGVMLGTGSGSFGALIPFATTTSPVSPGSPPPPTTPAYTGVFTVGDFNEDGNLDVAIVSAAQVGTGNVEILLGNGDGSFFDAGAVTAQSGATLSALDADDINSDGDTDLIAGATSASTSNLAVLLGNGDGTFGSAQLFAVSGPPVSISLGDFNEDGYEDILTINAAPGGQSIYPVEAQVLLNSQTVPATPTIGLATSASRVVAGASVKLTVSVEAPAPPPLVAGTVPSRTPIPVPSGTVTFSDGSTVLGIAALKNGRATITFTATGVGSQQISAAYSGDSNYAAATSGRSIKVLLTSAQTPLLAPTLTAATLPSLFISGDRGTIAVTLVNGGGARAAGRMSINVYLSPDGLIDASSILISIPTFQNHAIGIASGAATTLTGHFVAGKYAVGSYKIVVQLVPISGLTSANLTQTTLASTDSFTAAGMVFGTVGTHRNLALKITDAAGDRATLTLSGGGLGTVTQAGGVTDISVTGATSASRLVVATHGGTFSFDDITISDAIGAIAAGKVFVTGALDAAGGAKTITLAGMGGVGGAARLTLGAGSVASLSLGVVDTLTLDSNAALSLLKAASWGGGQINAPSIGRLNVKGSFGADVQVHNGGQLQAASLGSIVGVTWAVSGGIGTLRVTGDLSDASIYVGADTGPDDVLGTSDDYYTVAKINSVWVGGSVTSSLIVAGGGRAAGGTIFQGLILLSTAAIRAITVRGAVSDDSRFLAAILPRRARLDGVVVFTATDARFHQ